VLKCPVLPAMQQYITVIFTHCDHVTNRGMLQLRMHAFIVAGGNAMSCSSQGTDEARTYALSKVGGWGELLLGSAT